jgi:hypothetical protein
MPGTKIGSESQETAMHLGNSVQFRRSRDMSPSKCDLRSPPTNSLRASRAVEHLHDATGVKSRIVSLKMAGELDSLARHGFDRVSRACTTLFFETWFSVCCASCQPDPLSWTNIPERKDVNRFGYRIHRW